MGKEEKDILEELKYSVIFHDTIKDSRWLPENQSFSLRGGAMDYGAMYVLYRVLNEFQPKCVLEMGLGQSSKMISRYAEYSETVLHRIIEHDPLWKKFFQNHYKLPMNSMVIMLDIVDEKIVINGKEGNVTHYKNFYECLSDKHYDMIVIDGPYGYRSPYYSRIDSLSLIPQCLGKDFVIFMHDIDRVGEQNTMEMIKSKLSENKIKYREKIYYHSMIVCSENLKFFCSM